MSGNVSASSLERAAECPASFALPQAPTTGVDALRGTAIDRYVKRRLRGVPAAEALADIPDAWRSTCERLNLAGIISGLRNIRVDIAYAFNPITRQARELGVVVDRNYALLPDEIPGTVDVEGETLEGVPVIVDVKSGFLHLGLVEENRQLRFYALCKAALLEADIAEIRIAYVKPDGTVKVEAATLDRFSFDSISDELLWTSDRIAQAKERFAASGAVQVSAGEHCRYCPAVHSCPTKVALARALVPELATLQERLALMTPEQQGIAWIKVKEAAKIVEIVEDGLKACARQAPIPLPDGKELRATSFTRENLSQDKAIELLRAKGATEEEIAALYTLSDVEQVRAVKVAGAPTKRARAKAAE